jgi:hypothetical protein
MGRTGIVLRAVLSKLPTFLMVLAAMARMKRRGPDSRAPPNYVVGILMAGKDCMTCLQAGLISEEASLEARLTQPLYA